MKSHFVGKSIMALLATLCFSAAQSLAQTASPLEQLQKMVGQLQKDPADQALREKLIKLALTLDPTPAIPPEAERFMARGQAAMETAKEPGDFKVAVAEFEKATLAAPWMGNAYCNLGIVQDKVGDYLAAIRNLKLYLLATPGASDAKAVETLLYKIEFKQEKATKAKADEVAADKQRRDDEIAKKAQEKQQEQQRAIESFIKELSQRGYVVFTSAARNGPNRKMPNYNGVNAKEYEDPKEWMWVMRGPAYATDPNDPNCVVLKLAPLGFTTPLLCGRLWGDVQGPGLASIQWHYELDDGRKGTPWVKVWNGGKNLTISVDRSLREWDPNKRYSYMSIQEQ